MQAEYTINLTIDEILQNNIGLIKQCAFIISNKFNRHDLYEDLVSEGIIAFYEQINNFNSSIGTAYSTYIYPHLMGSMRRFIEQNMYSIQLSKREFQQLKDKSLHIDSLESYMDTGKDLSSHEVSVHKTVLNKIYIEIIEKTFNEELSFKEKFMLGSYYGVFGYEKLTLEDIGEYFCIKENAVIKARDKAFEKLRRVAFENGMRVWRSIHRTVERWKRN